jgi:hypothetical protein
MRLSPLLLAVVVSSCANIEYQPPPPGVPTAMLRFTTNTPDQVALIGVDRRDCPRDATAYLIAASEENGRDDFVKPTTLGMLGSSGQPEPRTQERLIEAGRPLHFKAWSVRVGARDSVCEIPGVFSPQPDRQYEMQFGVEEKKCSLTLAQLSLGPDGKVRRASEPFRVLRIRHAVKNFCDAE